MPDCLELGGLILAILNIKTEGNDNETLYASEEAEGRRQSERRLAHLRSFL